MRREAGHLEGGWSGGKVMEQMDAFRAEQQVDLLTGGGQHPVHLWMVRQHLTIMSNALR